MKAPQEAWDNEARTYFKRAFLFNAVISVHFAEKKMVFVTKIFGKVGTVKIFSSVSEFLDF